MIDLKITFIIIFLINLIIINLLNWWFRVIIKENNNKDLPFFLISYIIFIKINIHLISISL